MMSLLIEGKANEVRAAEREDGRTRESAGVKEPAPVARLSDTKTINTLPFHSAHDYSPHFNLEFDLAVQDYCRNESNLARLSKCNETLAKQPTKKKRPAKLAASRAAHSGVVRNCKVVVSGDVAVGKTCLVNRFGHAIYSSTYQTTIGVDFDLQRFSILGQPYVLQIWDTAGLERFRCITSSYYRGCQVALIVFDMSSMSTLANVVKWRDEILASWKTFDQLSGEYEQERVKLATVNGRAGLAGRAQLEAPLLFLVGTKSDLPLTEARRAFMREQANRVAAAIGAELWFVSAQTGENVNELFNRIAALSFNRCILNELQRLKFDASTMGACLREKLLQQQRELWSQSSKLIKITRKREGDDRRTRCVNVQCVIK